MQFNISQIEKDLKIFKKNDDVRRKLFMLYEWAESRSQKKTALKHGIHPRTLKRWLNSYQTDGIRGLVTQPKPGRPKKNWIRGRLAERILDLRDTYQWGAEVICAHLLKWHNIVVSQYRVHQLLKSKVKLRKTKKIRVKNKHTKVVYITDPGAHTQMDVRHLDGRNDTKKRYVYNFVDHASKWSYKRVYEGYGSWYTEDFFNRVLERCPFVIRRLQCDNGAEFTNKYRGGKEHILEKICKDNNIDFKLIPPGEKELQGLVEGHHKLDKDEFFERQEKTSVWEINARLDEHLEFKNSQRGYKSKNWRSPDEYIWDWTVVTLAAISLKKEKFCTEDNFEIMKVA